MFLSQRLSHLLRPTSDETETTGNEVEPVGDRYDQAMQLLEEAISAAPTMDDSPEKLTYILASLQKANGLLLQDEALTFAKELTNHFEAGAIDEETYRTQLDRTLDRFTTHGGLE